MFCSAVLGPVSIPQHFRPAVRFYEAPQKVPDSDSGFTSKVNQGLLLGLVLVPDLPGPAFLRGSTAGSQAECSARADPPSGWDPMKHERLGEVLLMVCNEVSARQLKPHWKQKRTCLR